MLVEVGEDECRLKASYIVLNNCSRKTTHTHTHQKRNKMIKRNHVSKSKLNMLLTCDVSIDLFNCSQVKIESKAQLSYEQ